MGEKRGRGENITTANGLFEGFEKVWPISDEKYRSKYLNKIMVC